MRMRVTEAEDFASCRMLHYWRWVRDLEPKLPVENFIAGRAWHAGAAILTRGDNYNYALQIVADVFDEAYKKPVGDMASLELKHQKIQALLFVYQDIGKKAYGQWSVEATEKECKLAIGDGVILVGHPDQILISRTKRNKRLIIERKKLSSTEALEIYPFDTQVQAYLALTGLNEIVMDLVKFPAHKLHKGEDPDDFVQRLIKIIQEKPSKYFHQETLVRDEDYVQSTLTDLRAIAQGIKECGADPKKRYHATRNCKSWRGCLFKKLCRFGSQAEHFYTQREEVRDNAAPKQAE